MSNYVTKIDVSTYRDRYSSFKEVTSLSTRENIATFFDTFEKANIKGYSIVKVLEINGKYIFVYDETKKDYDFFKEVNSMIKGDITVNAQNAKLMYDKSYSLGYYDADEVIYSDDSDDMSTGEIFDNVDDSSTGFLDDSDLKEIEEQRRVLRHKNTSARLPINDSHGVSIGRSAARAEYVVSGNTNVSRLHARVYKEGSKYMVHDCDSANGTFIDGLKVTSDLDREILVGSTLTLGNEEFILE